MTATTRWIRPLLLLLATACGGQAAVAPTLVPANRHLAPSLRPHAVPSPITVDTSARGAVISRDMIGFESEVASLPWAAAAARQIGMTFNLYIPEGIEPDVTAIDQYETAYVQPNHVD